jgi:hypothetical protein
MPKYIDNSASQIYPSPLVLQIDTAGLKHLKQKVTGFAHN